MPDARRTAAVVGVLLACSAVVAPTLLATSASYPTSVQLASNSPLQDAAKFQGRVIPTVLGRLHAGAVGLHHVTVVPLYFRTVPSYAVIEHMARAVARFYAREVPGTHLTYTYASVQRVTREVACQSKSALAYASLHTDVDPSASHVHILAWAPECPAAGYAWVRQGNGMMWVGGTNPQMLAHEFGHNLGLSHSNGLRCMDGASHQVTLSDRCIEAVYDDPFSVMGNQCDLESTCRLAGPDIAALTGQAVAVKPRSSRTLRIVTDGASGARTAFIKTPFGVVYFDAAPPSGSADKDAVQAAVQVRILTAANDALLRVPDVVSGRGSDGTLELRPFDAWTIPGTGTRVLVMSAGPASATLRFTPSTKFIASPTSPTITSVDHHPFNRPYVLTWTASSGVDLLGYAVSRYENGRLTSYRVSPRQTSLHLPGVTSAHGVLLKVWAISASGAPSRPATIRVSTNPTFIRITLSNKQLSPVSVDPLSPTFQVRVGARGTLQWRVDADQAASIKGWNVHVTLHEDATLDLVLPASARRWVLPPKVLASIRTTAVFAAPYVMVYIAPKGLRFDAEIALLPTR